MARKATTSATKAQPIQGKPVTKAAATKAVAKPPAKPVKKATPVPAKAAAKAPVKPAAAKSAPAKSTPKPTSAKPAPAKPAPAKHAPAKVAAHQPGAKAAPAPAKKKAPTPVKTRSRAERNAFFSAQRKLLLDERQTYTSSAEALKAQADSLALEHEPGDVQFDEEGGEGGTANVDREVDLYLSAQARATVVEIDRALTKIDDGTYGICEQCGNPIPDARLQALPYAALCVTCKSGGLSSRR